MNVFSKRLSLVKTVKSEPIEVVTVHIQGWLVDGWYVIMGKVLGIIHTQTAEVEPEVARVAIKLAILVGNIEQFTHHTLGFGWPVKPDLTVHARGLGRESSNTQKKDPMLSITLFDWIHSSVVSSNINSVGEMFCSFL